MKVNVVKTISFDVDSQNGFTPKCPGELPVADGHLIVDELNKNANFASARIMSKDAHPANGRWTADEDNVQFSKVGLKNVDVRWNQHCVVGTFGFELIKGLPMPQNYDFLVYKGVERNMHPYSAIYHDLGKRISTGVIEFAKHGGYDTFIVGGLALDYCLGETAIDLIEAGFKVIVNLSATKYIAITSHNMMFKKLKNAGALFIQSADDLEYEE